MCTPTCSITYPPPSSPETFIASIGYSIESTGLCDLLVIFQPQTSCVAHSSVHVQGPGGLGGCLGDLGTWPGTWGLGGLWLDTTMGGGGGPGKFRDFRERSRTIIGFDPDNTILSPPNFRRRSASKRGEDYCGKGAPTTLQSNGGPARLRSATRAQSPTAIELNGRAAQRGLHG